jgi:hypothetical protein
MKPVVAALKKHKNKLIPVATCVAGAVGGQPALNFLQTLLSFLGL